MSEGGGGQARGRREYGATEVRVHRQQAFEPSEPPKTTRGCRPRLLLRRLANPRISSDTLIQ